MILIRITAIYIGGTVKKRMQIRFSYRSVSQSWKISWKISWKNWKIRGNQEAFMLCFRKIISESVCEDLVCCYHVSVMTVLCFSKYLHSLIRDRKRKLNSIKTTQLLQ